MKNAKLSVFVLLVIVLLCSSFVLVSCGGGNGNNNEGSTPAKLTTPSVVLTDDIATWSADINADKFEICINGDFSYIENSVTSQKLIDGQTFKIRAIGDGINYTDSEWSNSVTYNATSDPILNSYTIIWKNSETILEVDTDVKEGTVPIYNGETPVKSSDVEFTYKFIGWAPNVAEANKNTTYYAVFESIKNEYTVTWKNEDVVLEIDTGVQYGSIPSYDGKEPVKAADARYTYTFSGWSPSVNNVTGDIIYVAQFEEKINTYTITWKNGENVLEIDKNIPYGSTPVYNGETPTKSSTDALNFTFSGWSPSIECVTGNMTYVAQFEDSVNKHLVRFIDEDGVTELGRVLVAHGETAVYPNSLPTKESTVDTVYSFEKWIVALNSDTENDLSNINKDKTISPTPSPTSLSLKTENYN